MVKICRSYFSEIGNPNYGHYTLTCHCKLCESQNFIVNSVIIIMPDSCYTHPLISPDLPLNHPSAKTYNSEEYATKNDLEFAQACQVASVSPF